MNNLVMIGKIIKAHGLDGKVKVLSDSNLKNKIFQVGQTLIVRCQKLTINSYQISGRYDIISFKDYLSIDLIEEFLGENIYVDINNLALEKNEFLLNELIEAKVIENEEKLGIVKDILIGKKDNFLVVQGDKQFLIPIIDEYILSFNRQEHEIYTQNAVNLII